MFVTLHVFVDITLLFFVFLVVFANAGYSGTVAPCSDAIRVNVTRDGSAVDQFEPFFAFEVALCFGAVVSLDRPFVVISEWMTFLKTCLTVSKAKNIILTFLNGINAIVIFVTICVFCLVFLVFVSFLVFLFGLVFRLIFVLVLVLVLGLIIVVVTLTLDSFFNDFRG